MSNAGEEQSKSVKQLNGALGGLQPSIKAARASNKPTEELTAKREDLKKHIANYNTGKGKLADQSKGKASGKGNAPNLSIADLGMEGKEIKDKTDCFGGLSAADSGIEFSISTPSTNGKRKAEASKASTGKKPKLLETRGSLSFEPETDPPDYVPHGVVVPKTMLARMKLPVIVLKNGNDVLEISGAYLSNEANQSFWKAVTAKLETGKSAEALGISFTQATDSALMKIGGAIHPQTKWKTYSILAEGKLTVT